MDTLSLYIALLQAVLSFSVVLGLTRIILIKVECHANAKYENPYQNSKIK